MRTLRLLVAALPVVSAISVPRVPQRGNSVNLVARGFEGVALSGAPKEPDSMAKASYKDGILDTEKNSVPSNDEETKVAVGKVSEVQTQATRLEVLKEAHKTASHLSAYSQSIKKIEDFVDSPEGKKEIKDSIEGGYPTAREKIKAFKSLLKESELSTSPEIYDKVAEETRATSSEDPTEELIQLRHDVYLIDQFFSHFPKERFSSVQKQSSDNELAMKKAKSALEKVTPESSEYEALKSAYDESLFAYTTSSYLAEFYNALKEKIKF